MTQNRQANLVASTLLAGLTLIIILGAQSAWACACCADRGERLEETSPIRGLEREVLAGVKFEASSTLYLAPGGWGNIKGMNNPKRSWEYRATVSKQGSDWTFQFDDRAGQRGSLQMALPKRLYRFIVDTDPGKKVKGRTRLYKELVLLTTVIGSGMFRKSGHAKARLILHGEGNHCDSVGQFASWTLDVDDNAAKYRFFGRLKPDSR